MAANKKNNKRIFWFIALLVALVLINFLATLFHQRYDLTEEKRYSLSRPTKELLRNLEEPVRIDVFLKGDFPAGFKKLANSVEEFLQEFKEYGKGNFVFNFIDPLENLNDTAAARAIDSINYFFDIPALTLQAPSKVGDEQTQKLVLPGAVIYYKDTTVGINLLQGIRSYGTEPEQLAALYNNVEASMEYKFASAIQKITTTVRPIVAYALGNGEAWGFNADDAIRTLISEYYFDTINIPQIAAIPPQINALVIMKPTKSFSDRDKLKIDQYVMNGGKVLWMVDNMFAEFDSLYKSQGFIAFDRNLNLEDIFFNYGVRLNQTLVQDMQSDKLPQVSGEEGGQQQQRLVDWPFFPILNGTDHPISKNLDGILSRFPTSIDTVQAANISKTFLLQTSNNTRLLNAPAKIDFEFLQIAPDQKLFNQKNVPIAVLLEGNFRSLYTGRVSKQVADSLQAMNLPFKASSGDNKMIVVADGDIAMNQYSQFSGPVPMGTNIFIPYTYANKDFFMNCMEYLVNPSDILQTRSKEFTLRLLDPRRVTDEKTKWQLINIALPIIIIILFGIIYQQVRKRKYTSV